jgi:hypothetical protein
MVPKIMKLEGRMLVLSFMSEPRKLSSEGDTLRAQRDENFALIKEDPSPGLKMTYGWGNLVTKWDLSRHPRHYAIALARSFTDL